MRRLLVLAAAAAIAVTGLVPAQAAAKRKPVPINFSYEFSLTPDPSGNATGRQGDGCRNLLAQGKNIRPFTVPAAGRLKITLTSPDPVGKGIAFDWDMWLMESNGATAAQSNSEFASGAIDKKFRKKIPLSIQVCALSGLPAKGKVTVNFVYA